MPRFLASPRGLRSRGWRWPRDVSQPIRQARRQLPALPTSSAHNAAVNAKPSQQCGRKGKAWAQSLKVNPLTAAALQCSAQGSTTHWADRCVRSGLPTTPQAQHQQKRANSFAAQGNDSTPEGDCERVRGVEGLDAPHTTKPSRMTRFHRGILCRPRRGTEHERSGQITSYENRTH